MTDGGALWVWSIISSERYAHDWNDGSTSRREVRLNLLREDLRDMLQGGPEPFSSMRVTR